MLGRKNKKWSSDAATGASEMLREALRVRLDAVWRCLASAAGRRDGESVHQLRVATRRAASILRAFPEVMPPRRAERLRWRLRRIRRAAGAARDCDVLIERLSQSSSDRQAADLLMHRIRAQRREAQAALKRVYRRMKKKRFPRQARNLLDRVRWRGPGNEPKLAAMAGPALKPAVEAFVRAAEKDLSQASALHRLRIRCKRLRYVMELFAGVSGSNVAPELYPAVREIQDRLGAINDRVSALDQFQRWQQKCHNPELAHHLGKLANIESRQLQAAHQQFHHWWTPERLGQFRQTLDTAPEPLSGGIPTPPRSGGHATMG